MLLETNKTSSSKPISLTPLIDVVFILLLFFMLSSSFSHWFAIDLSMPANTNDQAQQTNRIKLVNNYGELEFNGQQVEISELTKLLAQQRSEIILIDAEHQVHTQSIVTLIDALKIQGFDSVSLGTTFEKKDLQR